MNDNNKSKLTNEMIEYMNQKYQDDTFTYLSPYGGGAGADKKVIVARSEKCGEKDIYVSYSNQNNINAFSDNYLGVLFEPQVKDLLKNKLNDYFDKEVFVSYTASKFACPNKDGSMSFDEYISNYNSNIGFVCVVNAPCDNKDEIVANLEEIFVNSGVCCYGTIYFDNTLTNIDEIDDVGFSNYANKKTYECSYFFRMNDNTSFSKSEWSEKQ